MFSRANYQDVSEISPWPILAGFKPRRGNISHNQPPKINQVSIFFFDLFLMTRASDERYMYQYHYIS